MCDNKTNGISKMWIDTLNNYNVLAYTIGDNQSILIADNFIEDLMKMPVTEFVVKQPQNVLSLLDSLLKSKSDKENLEYLLQKAIREEDYISAASIQLEIKKL